MSPSELQRYQAIQISIRLLRAAQTAAQLAIQDLTAVNGLENADIKQEVDEILAQLHALTLRQGYRG